MVKRVKIDKNEAINRLREISKQLKVRYKDDKSIHMEKAVNRFKKVYKYIKKGNGKYKKSKILNGLYKLKRPLTERARYDKKNVPIIDNIEDMTDYVKNSIVVEVREED